MKALGIGISRIGLAAAAVFLGIVQAAGLEVDVGTRLDTLKRIIDFFPSGESTADFRDLKPRYIVPYQGRAYHVDQIVEQGCEPVLSLLYNTKSSAQRTVSEGAAKGVKHYVVWTEPNRTWGDWLTTQTWESFLVRSKDLHDGARLADSTCLLSGPCITTDPKDQERWTHLQSFLNYWRDNGLRLDYVNIHPPWEPDDLYYVSSLAKGYAKAFPAMGIKGVTVGEYPFFLDGLGVHVRFFLAFEECWNMLWAAKSNYTENPYNSGLVLQDGTKKPVYWLFHTYARMEGNRVNATTGGQDGRVRALASYNEALRTLKVLVGNDQRQAESVTLDLKGVVGAATVTVQGFDSSGMTNLGSRAMTAVDGRIGVDLGVIADGDARYVEVAFQDEQPVSVSHGVHRAVSPAASDSRSTRAVARIAPSGSIALPPDALGFDLFSLDGRRLWSYRRGGAETFRRVAYVALPRALAASASCIRIVRP